MSLEADIKRCLSLSGSLIVVLDGRGLFQVSVRAKDLHSYRFEIADDPFEAIAKVASGISDLDLPRYDVFEAAARRRNGEDGFLEMVERVSTPKALPPPPPKDALARAAVEGTSIFDDILG